MRRLVVGLLMSVVLFASSSVLAVGDPVACACSGERAPTGAPGQNATGQGPQVGSRVYVDTALSAQQLRNAILQEQLLTQQIKAVQADILLKRWGVRGIIIGGAYVGAKEIVENWNDYRDAWNTAVEYLQTAPK